MAGGNKKKDFSASPFRQLKGFCVGKEEKPDPAAPAPPERAAEPDVDFAGEMARLGVRRAGATEIPPASIAREPKVPAPVPTDDRELFLAALGKMEATFADELPETPAPPSTPRLKKLLQSEKFVPEAELDLHGLDRLRARERIRYFLENAIYQGKKTALLITGRGHGSTGEPVLRTEVESFLLREAGSWASEWTRAPRRFGGDGAFVVLLRAKKKD